MKKLAFILLSIVLFTACDNEPLDDSFNLENPIPNPNPEEGSESDDLSLSLYELDVDLTFILFGTPLQTITNSDLNIVDDKLDSGVNAISFEGSPFVTENQTITRNTSGQVTSDISTNTQGVVTNEYLITYEAGNVSTITYDYFEDDIDDFSYSFSFNGNTITRTEDGSTISSVFTLDDSGRVIQKESFDGEFSIQNEIIIYNANGNISNSAVTGELEQSSTYTFDTNTNPLKVVYSDNYLLHFLGDDYTDELGPTIAQFLSTNNWNGATFNGDSFTFSLTYNSVGRIETREIAFNLEGLLSTTINERFTYVN